MLIYHPAYGDQLKTYLYFDLVHLIKNTRKNFLNRQKFVFPEYHFDLLEEAIEKWILLEKCSMTFISWMRNSNETSAKRQS